MVIATHNHAHFLPECLASVKSQTYQDYEVIVINNGSTDNTEEVVKLLTWDKLRYYYQNDTGSVAGPRNTGIKLAQGEYVAFLDSDDLWYKNKLERVMHIFVEKPDIDIISHDLIQNKNGEKDEVLKVGPLEEDMFGALLVTNRLLGSATVIKKQEITQAGGFDESKQYVHCEDYETWLRIAYKGHKFGFINEVLGEYRVHGGNLSNDQELVFKNWLNVLNRHLPYYKGKNIFDRFLVYLRSKGCAYLTIAKRKIILLRDKIMENG